ncbi:acetyl-CoA hydrolase/transferase family protein [bacterium]|nr:acetyl-CoA hydrolase/transferase family protein [bacterium]
MTTTWQSRAVSPAEAVARVRSGMTVFLHGAAATPTPLVEALAARTDLEGVRIVHLHTNGPAPFADPGRERSFRSVSLFTGGPLRQAVAEGRADFVPVFLSDIPHLFASGAIRLDAALLQLSPPDRHGLCTLGTSVDAARAAADTAGLVIAEVNDQLPRTHGHTAVPLARVDAFAHTDRPLHGHAPEPETETDARIGELVAGLVPDRACLQMGIGGIPDAVLARLGTKRDLGVHTEMFSDRLVDLVATGAVTGKYKAVHPGRIVTSFVNGSRRLFDFVDDNPLVEFHPCDRTNDTALIRKNDNAVAINSAIQIDLTGQVCADSIGHRIYSGIGGQMDFVRGAALSRGGKAIIALPSTAKGGAVSRIVPELAPGAGVVTTRGHVHWVVTEFGAVDLHGRTLRERGERLVSVAHPDFRAELRQRLRDLRHYVV